MNGLQGLAALACNDYEPKGLAALAKGAGGGVHPTGVPADTASMSLDSLNRNNHRTPRGGLLGLIGEGAGHRDRSSSPASAFGWTG